VTTNRHLTIASTAHAQLVALDNNTAATLTHAHAQMLNRIEPVLTELYTWIDKKKHENDGAVIPATSYHAQLQAIKKVILAEADSFAIGAQSIIAYAQHQAVDLGLSSSHAHLAHIGVAPIHSPSALSHLADVADISTPRGKMFGSLGQETALKASVAFQVAMSLSQSPTTVASLVGSALKTILHRAIAIASTAIAAAYRGATDALVGGNNASGKILGWVWWADLKGNPCLACIFMHGSKHPMSEILGSHPRCHCQMVPYTADSAPIQSGADWLAAQPEDVQKAIFGSDTLYDLYKQGTPLSAFVGTESDPVWGQSIYVKPLKDIRR
jgi:hypothetical protein